MTKNVTLWLCQNSYWKWWFIVDLPIKNGGSVHSFLYVYQRVSYDCWLYLSIYILFIFHYTIIDHTSNIYRKHQETMVFTIKYRVFLFCKFSHHPILWVKLQKPLVKFSVTACCSPRLKLTACTENSPWKFTWRPGVWRVSSTNKQIIDDYCIYIYMKME